MPRTIPNKKGGPKGPPGSNATRDCLLLLLLALRYGPAPRLYATMFLLALAMELYGTWLGNWAWRAEIPWLGWVTLNPPFAAGAFYCTLDWLVGWVRKRCRLTPGVHAKLTSVT